MIFKKEKKLVLNKLNLLNLNDFNLGERELYIIPVGTAVILANLNNKEVVLFIKNTLFVYPTWKKGMLFFLLKMKLFPKIKIYFPKNFQLGRFGARTKFFDFLNKKIYTFTRNFREIKNREDIKKYFNCPKIINKEKNYFVEEFLFPYKNIGKEDIILVFKTLIEYYKKNLKGEKEKKDSMKVVVHGDLWKGNLIKFNNKIYFLDWDGFRKDFLTSDFIHFFEREYSYYKKIDRKLIRKVAKFFIKNFHINKKKFLEILKINILDLNKKNKQKKRFYKILENLIRKVD
jgi:hypothetical protein